MSEERPQAPSDPLGNLWGNIKSLGGKVEGGIEGLWNHLKSGLEETGKGYGEALAERSRPEIVPMRGGKEIRSTAVAPEGEPVVDAPRPGSRQWIAAQQPPGPESPVGQAALGFAGTTIGGRSALETKGIGDAISAGADAVKKVFAPTSRGPLAAEAEAQIREGTGAARQRIAQDAAAVEGVRSLEAPLIPEFRSYIDHLAAIPDVGVRRAVPKPPALRVLDAYETGAPLPKDLEHYKPITDAIRNIAHPARAELNADPLTDREVFIDNYYRHSYKEPTMTPGQALGSRQGSTSMLKRRSIPTLSEAIIEGGHVPTDVSMLDTMMRYSANVQHYLGANRIFHAGRETGNIKYFKMGEEPEGWVPLQGRLSQKAAAFELEGEPAAQTMRAYAPEPYARVYNNSAHVDPGWANAPAYQLLRHVANTSIMGKLGLSLFHATAMTEEATTSGLAKALGELTSGEVKEAAKSAGLSLIPASDIVRKSLGTGKKFQEQYLGLADHGPDFEKIVSLGTRAGGRFTGRGQEWRGTELDNYVRAFRRGTLKYELGQGIKGIAGKPGESAGLRVGLAAPRMGLMFGREVGRMMQSVTAPLFDTVIPRIKSAAFYDEMASYLRQNPLADDRAQMIRARQVWDSIDDRFGEMVLDNVFWDQRVKQGLQVIATSLGWQLGSYRGMGGAILDLARGQWSPRLRWAIMLPATWALYNSVYQYLKTGKPATDPSLPIGGQPAGDMWLPKTGGTLPSGMPERAIMPGYEKDVLGLWHDPFSKVTGAVNPAVTLGSEMMTGRDWRGQAIAPQYPGAPPWYQAWAKHVMEGFEPIQIQQQAGKDPRSAISGPETALGIRRGPAWAADPKHAEAGQKYGDLKKAIDRLGADISVGKRSGMPKSDLKKLEDDRKKANQELQKTIIELKKKRSEATPSPEKRARDRLAAAQKVGELQGDRYKANRRGDLAEVQKLGKQLVEAQQAYRDLGGTA